MARLFDVRQSLSRTAFPGIGSAANASLDVILADINTLFADATYLPTPSVLMTRDANGNTQANNFIESVTSTVTAAATTTLTVASTYSQIFTGTTTQTVQLPAANTLALGQAFYITNRSTGVVTVNDGSSAFLQTMASNSQSVFTVTNIGSVAGTWDDGYSIANPLSNPMTTSGEMIYSGAGGTPEAMTAGTSGQVPISSGTAVAFGSLPGNATALLAPTVQTFTSTGTQTGFVVTQANTAITATAGAVYTVGGNNYTLLNNITSSVGPLFFSGTASLGLANTLTKVSGTGPTTIVWSDTSFLLYASTYTTPSSPAPLYIKIRMVGGGGGGGGSGSGVSAGTSGSSTFFGVSILEAGPGTGGGGGDGTGTGSGAPAGIGGTATSSLSGGLTFGGSDGDTGAAGVTTAPSQGGSGGTSVFGGAGRGGTAGNGDSGKTNTGSGGGGGAATDATAAGSGGGAGAYVEQIITSPVAASYLYVVGTGGVGGGGGSASGGSGAAGFIVVEEFYQ
jgi:hypothetical protein